MVIICSDLVEYIEYMFEFKKANDTIRSLTLESLFNTWSEHPGTLLYGNGYAAEFYDIGRGKMVDNAELSYWLMLWRLGLVGFAILIIMFVLPIITLIKIDMTLAIAYGAYLVVAYTNPLLYSSTGVTVLLYVYWKVADLEKSHVVRC